MSKCQVDPMGTGIHSDDTVAVYHGSTTPTMVCGYHATYWPELVGKGVTPAGVIDTEARSVV